MTYSYRRCLGRLLRQLCVGVVAVPMLCPQGQADEPPADRESILRRIEALEQRLRRLEAVEQRVEELESTTVLSEPETRVKQVEVWVDEAGVEHATQEPGTRRVVTYQRERVYRRQTINDKIEAALDDAAARTVQVGVDAAIVLQNVQQTNGSDARADGNTYQLASADLLFTAGLAKYTVFYADVVGLSGTPPDGEVEGLSLLNGYAARLREQNRLELREAWLMTELWSQRLTLVAGRLDLTNYFDGNAAANDETTQFISDALVNNPTLGLSENGAGLAAIFDPRNGFRLKAGYQQSSSTATNLSDSLFYLTEASYEWTPFDLGEGNYRIWYRTDNSSGKDQNAFGISMDQKLSSGLTLFARYGSAESESRRDHFYSGGLQFRADYAYNPEDAWGLGYSYYSLGPGDRERLAEAYYNLRISGKLQFSLILTHVSEDPAGSSKISYVVPGLRLQAGF